MNSKCVAVAETFLLALLLGTLGVQNCSADVFYFKDGRVLSGTVEGDPIERKVNEVPVKFWTVKLGDGDFIQISERELKHNGHDAPSENELEYARLIQASPPTTAEQHCRVASWCHGKLPDLEQAHYFFALDLDPDHEVARAGAGFRKDRNGDWVLKEKVMGEERGKVLQGRIWVFPEEVVVTRAREAAAAELAPIRKRMNTLHTAIAFGRSEKMRRESIAKIQRIQDPREANIMAEYLLDQRRKANVNVRLMYVNILSRFPNAIPALTNASLNDEAANVRSAARDALRSMDARSAVPTFLSYLGNPNNTLVNRAAKGLALFEPRESILPLIEALVTTHEEVQGGGNSTYSMQGGLTLGGSKKKVKVDKNNPAVLDALVQTAANVGLTNGGFDYNKDRWFAWYASRFAAPVADLRRDP